MNAPADHATGKPAGTPVSSHLRISRAAQWQSAREALAAIDLVHGNGSLPEIAVIASADDPGAYRYSARDGRALRIELKPISGPNPQLTLAQEIGHFLDHQTLGTRNSFASVNGEIADLTAVIGQSESIRGLSQRRGRKTATIDVRRGRRQREFIDRDTVDYLLLPEEQFGRAYAQYIAVRSGNATMVQQLDRIRRNLFRQGIYYEYWSDADFAPIAAAFDALFREKGWIS